MSVGKILLLLVNLKYLIILIIYFHLQNLCSSKSVSRHLLIIILGLFFLWGGVGGRDVGWYNFSLTISANQLATTENLVPVLLNCGRERDRRWRGVRGETKTDQLCRSMLRLAPIISQILLLRSCPFPGKRLATPVSPGVHSVILVECGFIYMLDFSHGE